jgi:hypothetical protein
MSLISPGTVSTTTGLFAATFLPRAAFFLGAGVATTSLGLKNLHSS